jgi:CheY-like chemotaxis protein
VTKPTRSRVNILLVDDQPANLLVMQTVLGALDENLICANSGEEALRAVLQTDFAAILLDVRMPTMSGFDTARLIRSHSRSSRVAILFITASVDAGFPIEEAYTLGAVDYLTKPIQRRYCAPRCRFSSISIARRRNWRTSSARVTPRR